MSSTELQPRRKPAQVRSIRRAQEIKDVTVMLLDRVGFDDLTTILITKELGISVGSLYHYFPNKHAILRAIVEDWLQQWDRVLEELTHLEFESMTIKEVVFELNNSIQTLYEDQKGVLPLIHAMYAVPELRDLDGQHDRTVALKLSQIFRRVGFKQSNKELQRIATTYIEISHTMLMMILDQKGVAAKNTLNDFNGLSESLLTSYK